MFFRNYYKCPRCSRHWIEEHDGTLDDDCPGCGLSRVSPYRSEGIDEEDGE